MVVIVSCTSRRTVRVAVDLIFGRGAQLLEYGQLYPADILASAGFEQLVCPLWRVAGGRVVLAGCDSRLHIIDVETGKEIDSVEIDAPTGSTAAMRDELKSALGL